MKAPNAQENAPARVPEREEPKPDGYCHNCGLDLRTEESFCTPVCADEWRRFQRKP